MTRLETDLRGGDLEPTRPEDLADAKRINHLVYNIDITKTIAVDITVQKMHIESLYPLDEDTRRAYEDRFGE